MSLNKFEQDEIYKSLGTVSNDRRIAKFYIKAVFDAEKSTGEARRRADAEAQSEAKRTGQIVEANYKRENLKRLGAKNKYKDVLYINIKHSGQTDNKSRIATDEDKLVFKQSYDSFMERTANNYLSLELLPNITASEIKEMQMLGIKSISDLAESKNTDYPQHKQTSINLMGLQNGNIREERENLQISENRPQYSQESSSWNGGNFKYSFNI